MAKKKTVRKTRKRRSSGMNDAFKLTSQGVKTVAAVGVFTVTANAVKGMVS